MIPRGLDARRTFIGATVAFATVFVVSSDLLAQRGGAAAPAPARDISGVWMMRNPPGSNRGFTNFTFTDPKLQEDGKGIPALTPWGLEKFKEARDSNGGNYRLDETNDPVLTKCYPRACRASTSTPIRSKWCTRRSRHC